MRVELRFIDHADQRYPTAGDWFWNEQKTLLTILVSRTRDRRSDFAVAVHELVEALACEANGISQEEVDAWDMHGAPGEDDPGSNPGAPYHHEHTHATQAEEAFCTAVDLPWEQHDDNVDQLFEKDR